MPPKAVNFTAIVCHGPQLSNLPAMAEIFHIHDDSEGNVKLAHICDEKMELFKVSDMKEKSNNVLREMLEGELSEVHPC